MVDLKQKFFIKLGFLTSFAPFTTFCSSSNAPALQDPLERTWNLAVFPVMDSFTKKYGLIKVSEASLEKSPLHITLLALFKLFKAASTTGRSSISESAWFEAAAQSISTTTPDGSVGRSNYLKKVRTLQKIFPKNRPERVEEFANAVARAVQKNFDIRLYSHPKPLEGFNPSF